MEADPWLSHSFHESHPVDDHVAPALLYGGFALTLLVLLIWCTNITGDPGSGTLLRRTKPVPGGPVSHSTARRQAAELAQRRAAVYARELRGGSGAGA